MTIRHIGLAAGLLLTALPALAQQQQALSSADVQRIVAQAAQEASARGRPASITVTDRVGNVLAVYTMPGAPLTLRVTSGRGLPQLGLEELVIDQAPGAALAASIAKALTGAYLSSSGNAFSSRTASQIVQENFNPGERFQPGGPLSGVQFSQLPCSDLAVRAASDNGGRISATLGPKRSPLGLSADPGGLPLFRNGVVVGGIGVEADGLYSLDRNIFDRDTSDEELIAVAGSAGFEAPVSIRADRIAVDGRTLRYTDRGSESLRRNPAGAPAVSTAGLVSVRGYYDAAAGFRAGSAYGSAASGFRVARVDEFAMNGAMILVDEGDSNRYPPRDGSDGDAALQAAEVRVLLEEAYRVIIAARAQIRRPLNSAAQVTVSVVDSNGVVLGLVRTADAPVFGTDVSLQKARSAAFFSGPNLSTDLTAAGQGARLALFRQFVGGSDGSSDGSTAWSARGIGNLARPFFADGINGAGPGPLADAFDTWSPFSTGLQLDLVLGNIVQHVFHVLAGSTDVPASCTALPASQPVSLDGSSVNRLANGLQIFPGGVPIYRGGRLVGGIGVSGDGIDQDDMVAFLGLDRAGDRLGGAIGNAPAALRDDRLTPDGVRLRYVSCPFSPFLGSREQNPCAGQ
jgi:uncharacterized protein GlcG (DUF336 family)